MRKIFRFATHYWQRLGPGLVTGAADDDPSGIATYAQAGARFGYALGWTMLLAYPLMAAIQEISARIGRTTSLGLAGNLRLHYPATVLRGIVSLLLIANVINLGADLGAMGDAMELIAGGRASLWALGFGLVCVGLQLFTDYRRCISILKWLTLSLFAYVGVVLIVRLPTKEALGGLLIPHFQASGVYWSFVVAVFGTTISPYLFSWQSTQEAEEVILNPHAHPLLLTPEHAPDEERRIRFDTWVGMGFSNLVGLFVMFTAAATLHAHGITDIQTSAQAAEALRPLAGEFAFELFALGIIGTGLLAVPILSASSAYAVGEAMDWYIGLGRRPHEAQAFYATLAGATLIGALINFVDIDPMKALFWSAVINGVIAVPMMLLTMHMSASNKVMGDHRVGGWLKGLGWLATLAMVGVVAAMFVTMG